MQAKLKPLNIVGMRDLGRVVNAKQLQVNLTRLCASAIPNHWSGTMPPDQTEPALSYAVSAIATATAAALHTSDSPSDRAAAALQCSRLATRGGGIGHANHSRCAPFNFVATFIAVWPCCFEACPELASLSITTAAAPTIAGFRAAYAHVTSTLASVRDRHSALVKDTRVWVDGSCHSAYHLPISRALELPPLAELFDATSTLASRFSQRSLAAIVNCDAWMDCKMMLDAFDSANPNEVCHREAARFVSCSQEGAGAWLSRLPDASLRHSVIDSATFLLLCQRRLGLHLTALKPALDEAARRGELVTEHMRLGDHHLNKANATNRHNAGLRATFTAISALSTANQVWGSFALRDRGDGTCVSREEARRRYAHINDGHVPNAIRYSIPPCCYEFKCYTPMVVNGALGHDSADRCGAASTADGDVFAFGNTEEAMRAKVLGLAERGDRSKGPLDGVTGHGWVREKLGDYADALSKGHTVLLLGCESTGAIFTALALLLKTLCKAARMPGTHDSTVYGSSRAAPQAFYAHHVAAISSAVVCADASQYLTPRAP